MKTIVDHHLTTPNHHHLFVENVTSTATLRSASRTGTIHHSYLPTTNSFQIQDKQSDDRAEDKALQSATAQHVEQQDTVRFISPATARRSTLAEEIPSSDNTEMSESTPLDRPKRPLSAYNLFFQDERAKLIQDQPPPGTVGTAYRGKRCRRITFSEMGKIIGARWRQIDRTTKRIYEDRAAEEKRQFKIRMNVWRKQQESLGLPLARPQKKKKTPRDNNPKDHRVSAWASQQSRYAIMPRNPLAQEDFEPLDYNPNAPDIAMISLGPGSIEPDGMTTVVGVSPQDNNSSRNRNAMLLPAYPSSMRSTSFLSQQHDTPIDARFAVNRNLGVQDHIQQMFYSAQSDGGYVESVTHTNEPMFTPANGLVVLNRSSEILPPATQFMPSQDDVAHEFHSRNDYDCAHDTFPRQWRAA